jgi:hypothetical protein
MDMLFIGALVGFFVATYLWKQGFRDKVNKLVGIKEDKKDAKK